MADQPSRGGVTGQWLTPPVMNVKVDYVGTSGGIVRGTGADWFGPLNPITPYAPPEVASRQWDYQAGYNLAIEPRQYEAVGFKTLRAIADSFDVLRTVIETRKDQVSRMAWTIKARDPKQQDGALGKIKTATDFFSRPDLVNVWPDWLRMILEDLFVIDAPTIYMQRSRVGKLLALLPIDGATIVPKIDDWGRTPRAYFDATGKKIVPVAYQQVLHGVPSINYSAPSDMGPNAQDLLYRPRNKRANRAYGYSPVEQIVTTINIALRRQLFLLDYYTEGNIPDSIAGVPPEWTPDQIRTWQNHWDSYFEGNLGKRRRMKFVPGGVGKSFIQTKEPELKNEFDEWIAKIVCFVFSISAQPFTKQTNRATAETQKEMAEEEGLQPILAWIKTMMDDLLKVEFNSSELEFAWGEDKEIDESAQAVILEGYVSKGIYTINEARAKMGMDPLKDPAADQPMIVTATGYVPLNANTIEGKQANMAAFGTTDGSPPPPPPVAPGGPSASAAKPGASKGKPAATPPKASATSGAKTAAKAANNARTLYVNRPLTNPEPLIAWAKANGFETTLEPSDLHTTVAFSRSPVDWSLIPTNPVTTLTVGGGERSLQRFGDAVVLKFSSADLSKRWAEFGDNGASWDHPEYQPHVTLSYKADNVDLSKVLPFNGDLHFGPEAWAEVKNDWKDGVAEKSHRVERLPFTKAAGRRPGPVPFDRPTVAKAVKSYTRAIAAALAATKASVVRQLRDAPLGKAADDDMPPPDDPDAREAWSARKAAEIAAGLDLSELASIADDETLPDLALDSVQEAVAMLGVSDRSELVDQVNEAAVAIARDRAAELVGKRVLDDGTIIDNPDAEWAITDSTRDMIRNAIADGLADNIGRDDIISNIEDLTGFDEDRAEMVAETEIARVNSQAALEGYRGAASIGVNVKKEWLIANDAEGNGPVCDDCQDNADEGPIDLDADFPSGDDAPPGHPYCRCALSPVVYDETDDQADGASADEGDNADSEEA